MGEEKLQYAKFGRTLVPVGETIPRLPAGFYDIEHGLAGYGIVPASPVSDELIDIPGTPADDITEDIERFLSIKDRYMRAGLTHKRGYLFFGPPGTGKTSLGLMIARRFIRDVDGIVFYVPNSGILRIAVEIMRKVEEPGRPSMFLMEEADNFINDVQALSILDGELSLAGTVFVAMTNYREKMPPRIANRPGRFDRVTYIGAPPYRVQMEYIRRLVDRLGEDHPHAAKDIADALDGLPVSMAHLREAFIAHVLMGVHPDEIRKRFEQMASAQDPAETPEPDDDDDNSCYGCEGNLTPNGDCPNTDCEESPYYVADSETAA